MIYLSFEEYLRKELGISQMQKCHGDFYLPQVATSFEMAANLAFAGGYRLEYFLWRAVPQLSSLDNRKVLDLIVEHYTQQGYTLVKRDPPDDVDFEKEGVKYFASFDLFPQMLKFSFDRQIDLNSMVR